MHSRITMSRRRQQPLWRDDVPSRHAGRKSALALVGLHVGPLATADLDLRFAVHDRLKRAAQAAVVAGSDPTAATHVRALSYSRATNESRVIDDLLAAPCRMQ
jgi:anti-sigma factor RsiW